MGFASFLSSALQLDPLLWVSIALASLTVLLTLRSIFGDIQSWFSRFISKRHVEDSRPSPESSVVPPACSSAPSNDVIGYLPSNPSDVVALPRMTRSELAQYASQEPSQDTSNDLNPRPIYLSVCGEIFDISSSASMYPPGRGYGVFTGRECSRALAKMSVNVHDACGYLQDLSEKEFSVLKEWQKKYRAKYPIVAILQDWEDDESVLKSSASN